MSIRYPRKRRNSEKAKAFQNLLKVETVVEKAHVVDVDSPTEEEDITAVFRKKLELVEQQLQSFNETHPVAGRQPAELPNETEPEALDATNDAEIKLDAPIVEQETKEITSLIDIDSLYLRYAERYNAKVQELVEALGPPTDDVIDSDFLDSLPGIFIDEFTATEYAVLNYRPTTPSRLTPQRPPVLQRKPSIAVPDPSAAPKPQLRKRRDTSTLVVPGGENRRSLNVDLATFDLEQALSANSDLSETSNTSADATGRVSQNMKRRESVLQGDADLDLMIAAGGVSMKTLDVVRSVYFFIVFNILEC